MCIGCQICFESYTDPGTEHAPYSAPCGHVMGKSCMQKLKEYGSNGKFNCPFCNKGIVFEWCHPIYFMPDQFFTSTSNSKNHTTNSVLKNNGEGNSTEEVEMSNSTKTVPPKLVDKGNSNEEKPHSMGSVKIKENCQEINLSDFFIEHEDTNKDEISLNVSNYPYYHRKLKREDADKYLNSEAVVGDFILRDSETNVGDYSISLKGITRNRHYWIRVNKDTSEYTIGKKTFKSLDLLIDFYKAHPICICEETNEILYLIKPLPSKN
uniref:Dreadlocks (inferred by orthology to a D. melanogaster protein) n=1 Tax=Strongyloides venezuelensis TaxID=75913 RepID=A0A0K0FC03_STRVS